MRHLSLLLFSLFLSFHLNAEKPFRILSYNTENFFVPKRDSSASAFDFSSQSIRRWTHKRYKHKLSQIAKVIIASGEEVLPSLVGLCEVGGERVLYDLLHFTPLRTLGYEYLLAETHDIRGIHTALLYRKDAFRPIQVSSFEVDLSSFSEARPTRCVLYAKGIVKQRDTLHVFVLHSPSRSGGVQKTEALRLKVAERLSSLVDSVFSTDRKALVVAMGDFNDERRDKSFQEGISAFEINEKEILPQRLYLLQEKAFHFSVEGSYKYHGVWYSFDQILLSSECICQYRKQQGRVPFMQVCDFDFLLTEDETYLGWRPFSTYYGMKYKGGFSDHLPVRVDLYWGE